MHGLNLARRPFLNRRPLFRLAGFLWVLGVALLVLNVWLYGSYLNESGDIRSKLADLDTAIENEEARFTELEERFERLDLTDQNLKAVFLNWLIANRTFPWSDLFDDLEDVLPADARLLNLRPEVMSEEVIEKLISAARRSSEGRSTRSSSRSGSRRASAARQLANLSTRPEEVALRFEGIAKNDDALMEFVDALYDSPIFKNPDLDGDRLDRESGDVAFSLGVTYLLWQSDSETDGPSTELAEGLTEETTPSSDLDGEDDSAQEVRAEAGSQASEDAEDSPRAVASAGEIRSSGESRSRAGDGTSASREASPRGSSTGVSSEESPTRLGGAMTPNRPAPPPQAIQRANPSRGAAPARTNRGRAGSAGGGLREVPPSPLQDDGPPPDEVRSRDRDRRPATSMPPSASGSPRLRRNGR